MADRVVFSTEQIVAVQAAFKDAAASVSSVTSAADPCTITGGTGEEGLDPDSAVAHYLSAVRIAFGLMSQSLTNLAEQFAELNTAVAGLDQSALP